MNKLTCKISKTEETLMLIVDLTPLDALEMVEVITSLMGLFRSVVGTKINQLDNEIVEDCVEKKKFFYVIRRDKTEGYEKEEISSRKILAENSIKIVDLD